MNNGNQSLFTTVLGRRLVEELPFFVHRPAAIITMEDLWEKFVHIFDNLPHTVTFVKTMDFSIVEETIEKLPVANCVIGLGGGQAIDFAKLVAWKRRIPLFQVPTATTVDAAFCHRAAVRINKTIRYIGWAVPEAIYIDFDVIQHAPVQLNRSGVGDVLCFHTAHYDWWLAHIHGKEEPQWPYDPNLVQQAQKVLHSVWEHIGEIRNVSEKGIRTLVEALRWGGATFHNAGWNPRPVEGVEHLFFYTLEHLTGKTFLHGQPVCLGIYIGSVLQQNKPEEILNIIKRAGVDIRPVSMGICWDDVFKVLDAMKNYGRTIQFPYTIIEEVAITGEIKEKIKKSIENTYEIIE